MSSKTTGLVQNCATGALVGLRVLELGSTVAAPFCGRLLADFGADVTKIEPLEGDTVRTMGRQLRGHSLYAASIFRNKRLIALDLQKEKGREIVRQIVNQSDVVIENFRPGRLEEWGLGYQELAASNPGLILLRISGYGQTGPYRERTGYGVTCEAISGLRELTGDPDRPPARVAVSLTDEVAGIYGAYGVMLALRDRDRTGLGQVIDTALYEAAFSLIEPHVPAYGSLGVTESRAGSRLPGSAPNNIYPAKDGKYIQITAITNALFRRLAEVMKTPELSRDSRFATPSDRVRNESALNAIVSQWTRGIPLMDLESMLDRARIPCARIYNVKDIFQDPHFRAREMLVELHHDALGLVVVPGIVPKLSRGAGRLYRAGAKVGADTIDVLRNRLHLDDGTISALIREKVIHVDN